MAPVIAPRRSALGALPAEALLRILQACECSTVQHRFMDSLLPSRKRWREALRYKPFYEELDDANLTPSLLLLLCRNKWTIHILHLKLVNLTANLRTRDMELIFSSFPSLTNLEVSKSRHFGVICDQLTKRDHLLSRLELSYGERKLFPHMFYGFLYEKGNNLTKFILTNCPVSNMLVLLNTIADFCPNLCAIKIADNVTRANVFPVTKFQVKCPFMRTIVLTEFRFSYEQGVESGFPALKRFKAVYCRGDLDDEVLHALLHGSPGLLHLDVSFSSVTTQGLVDLPANDLRLIFLTGTAATRAGEHMLAIERWRHSLDAWNYRFNVADDNQPHGF